jgi:prepilin signal peptidase PulO-like enzyme (type II secretory pathway)
MHTDYGFYFFCYTIGKLNIFSANLFGMSYSLHVVLGVLFGLVGGSGCTVWLWRAEHPELRGRRRSSCSGCGRTLAWFDLIPLLSFILLRGRCRRCDYRIPYAYVATELVGGVVGGLLVARAVYSSEPLGHILVASLWCVVLVMIGLYDAWYRLLPMILVWVLLFGGGLFQVLIIGRPLSQVAVTTFGAASFFLAQYLISKGRWIGSGDIWLGAVLGAWFPLPLLLLTFWSAYVGGACIGVGLLIVRREKGSFALPLGTFLAGGAIVSYVVGDQIIAWYRAIYLG